MRWYILLWGPPPPKKKKKKPTKKPNLSWSFIFFVYGIDMLWTVYMWKPDIRISHVIVIIANINIITIFVVIIIIMIIIFIILPTTKQLALLLAV